MSRKRLAPHAVLAPHSILALHAGLAMVASLLAIAALGWFGYRCYLTERELPPPSGEHAIRVGPPLTDRFVLVLIDSLREDAANDPEVSPAFARIASHGAKGVNITPPMTLTLLSVACLGTGMTPPISWSMKNFNAEPFEDENVFSLFEAAGLRTALVGDASWTQLFGSHAKHTLGLSDHGFFRGIHDGISDDDLHTLTEAEKVLADPSYDVIVIHVVSADKTAHQKGAKLRKDDGSLSEYARAVRTLNDHVLALYERFGGGGTWLILSDHGCTLRGNHGGGEEEARRAPFAWSGPGIAVATGVEQPLTSMAPTMTALFGLRAPRTAETSAAFSFLTTAPADAQALGAAQLAVREEFVARAAGETAPERIAPDRIAPDAAVEATLARLNDQLQASDSGRTRFRTVGVSFGLLVQFILLALIARAMTMRRVWLTAAIWAIGSWLLLVFGSWQFKAVAFLGDPIPSLGAFAVRAASLIAIAAALVVVKRRLGRLEGWDFRGVAWLGWAFVVMLLGQSVMRWPYGPLPEMYRLMTLVGLVVVTVHAFRAKAGSRVRWAVGLVGAGLFYLVVPRLMNDGDDLRLTDVTWTTVVSSGLYAAAIIGLGVDSWFRRDERRRSTPALWVGLAALAAAASYYHVAQAPWMVKGLIIACLLPVVALATQRPSPRLARNVVMAVALVLTRALAVDTRLIVLILFGGLAWAISEVRTKNGALTLPAAAAFAVLAHQSLFYETGYSFSFSTLDMTVAFAATRDAIDLGEGFVFLMVQHLGSWLIPIAALVYGRVINDDRVGIRAVAVALCGTFVIQAWGAFASFEYEIDNHWFTMHAVPLVVFSACNAMLVGISVLAGLTIRGELEQSRT